METSLRVSYNLILFFALIFSVFIPLPGLSIQLILLVLIAFTASIFLIPIYIIIGLFLPVFIQGGGIEYIHEPYFLILILFAFSAVIIHPLLSVNTSKPWIWYPFLVTLYLLIIYILFFILSMASHFFYGTYLDLGMDMPAFIIMVFSTLVAGSFLVVSVNAIKERFQIV